MARRLPTAVLITVVAATTTGAAPSGEHPTPDDTRRELEAVCRRLEAGDNLYFGRAGIGQTKAALERPDLPLENRLALSETLSHHLHRIGDLEGAIEVLEGMVTTLEGASPELRDRALDLVLLRLGMAHLQLAEEQNCVADHTAASCILPVAPEAVHRTPKEARIAGDLFARILDRSPQRPHVRWLLNIARMVSGDYPGGVAPEHRVPAEIAPVPDTEDRWPEISSLVGIHGMDLSGGAAVEDFDGDGLLDVVTSTIDPCGPMKAWRNDGRGSFEDVAAEWGLDGQLGGLNFTTADYDGDGMIDILVLRGGWFGEDGRIRNSLLRNDLRRETGRFVDVTAAAGLAWPAYPTQTAGWADYDGDGDIDVYIGNESTVQTIDPLTLSTAAGRSYPAQLFRNEGDGTFTDVARAAGVINLGFAKGVAWGDIDDDGDPDLFVSNIGDNRLYRNEGDGTFTDVATEAGVSGPYRTFPTWFFDHDNDGDLDLFVADYGTAVERVSAAYLGAEVEGGHPVLYRNDGDGSFTDVSEESGFRLPALPMGASWGDIDGDGWPDLYLGTGVPDFHALLPNVMYRNDGAGGFEDVTFEGAWGHLQKGHGIAFGDLDNDGDLDLFQQLGGAFPYDDYRNVLYENPGSGNDWIVLELVGRKANRFGVGGRIAVRVRTGEDLRTFHTLVGTGGSFGASSHRQELGLGTVDAIEELVIRWPGSGTVDRHRNVEVNRFYRAVEGAEALELLDLPTVELGAGGSVHGESAEHR